MDDTPKQSNKTLIGIIVAVVLVGITAGVIYLSTQKPTTNNDTSSNTNSSTTAPPSSSSGNTTTETGSYKDGSYEAEGTYQSPGGGETVTLKVTLTGGVITATEFTTDPSGGTAKSYQDKFISGYKAEVIGKKVDEVSLTRVAGSSLTPNGFNRALDQIKSDAKA